MKIGNPLKLKSLLSHSLTYLLTLLYLLTELIYLHLLACACLLHLYMAAFLEFLIYWIGPADWCLEKYVGRA